MTKPFAAAPNNNAPEPMMDMNMTPLIDVMLVLIIMLIITIPKQHHAVNLDLPRASTNADKPLMVTIEVDFDGTILWDGTVVPTRPELELKLAAIAASATPIGVQVRPNKLAAYKTVAGVMTLAQRARVSSLGIIGNEQFI